MPVLSEAGTPVEIFVCVSLYHKQKNWSFGDSFGFCEQGEPWIIQAHLQQPCPSIAKGISPALSGFKASWR